MEISRRGFLGLSGLTGFVLVPGCENDRSHMSERPVYSVDLEELSKREQRLTGVLVGVEDGDNRREQKVVRVMIPDESEEREYCISVRQNGRHPGVHLSLDQIRESSIGDFVSFPTKNVNFDTQTGEYGISSDVFTGKNTYGVVDLDRVGMEYNPDKEKFVRDYIIKKNQKLKDLYEMRKTKG